MTSRSIAFTHAVALAAVAGLGLPVASAHAAAIHHRKAPSKHAPRHAKAKKKVEVLVKPKALPSGELSAQGVDEALGTVTAYNVDNGMITLTLWNGSVYTGVVQFEDTDVECDTFSGWQQYDNYQGEDPQPYDSSDDSTCMATLGVGSVLESVNSTQDANGSSLDELDLVVSDEQFSQMTNDYTDSGSDGGSSDGDQGGWTPPVDTGPSNPPSNNGQNTPPGDGGPPAASPNPPVATPTPPVVSSPSPGSAGLPVDNPTVVAEYKAGYQAGVSDETLGNPPSPDMSQAPAWLAGYHAGYQDATAASDSGS